jgi:dTDP-4-amino-4,6-dideoxygalactose transaminase
MQRMLDAGVTTRRGIMCAHREPAYVHQPWRGPGSLGRSERAQDRSILLPLFPGLTVEEQQDVVKHLHLATRDEATIVRAA